MRKQSERFGTVIIPKTITKAVRAVCRVVSCVSCRVVSCVVCRVSSVTCRSHVMDVAGLVVAPVQAVGRGRGGGRARGAGPLADHRHRRYGASPGRARRGDLLAEGRLGLRCVRWRPAPLPQQAPRRRRRW
jgi:hypothetical protein